LRRRRGLAAREERHVVVVRVWWWWREGGVVEVLGEGQTHSLCTFSWPDDVIYSHLMTEDN